LTVGTPNSSFCLDTVGELLFYRALQSFLNAHQQDIAVSVPCVTIIIIIVFVS